MSYDRKLDDEGIPPLDDPEALEWMMNVMLPFVVASATPQLRMLVIARAMFCTVAKIDARCGERGVHDLMRLALMAIEAVDDDRRAAEIAPAGNA